MCTNNALKTYLDIFGIIPMIQQGGIDYTVKDLSRFIKNEYDSLFIKYNTTPKNEIKTLCGFIIPPFQRPEVWDINRKIKLIESIIMGFDIGTLVVQWTDDEKLMHTYGWLIDGQQRLSSIRDFILGKFKIFDNKYSYDDIQNSPQIIKYRFNTYIVKFQKISGVNVEQLKEFYHRMNYCGVPHN